MSAELDAAGPPVEGVPFPVRQANRLSVGAPGPDLECPDRRLYPRLSANELVWLRGARLKAGPDVSLVDISKGGALLETGVQLRPGSRATLEILITAADVDVLFEVLRCQISSLAQGVRYRGACAFRQPFELEHLERLAQKAVIERGAQPAGTPWQKIVVRFRDGRLQKGFTLDFSPTRGHFSLWPSIQATVSERSLVPLAHLKAVFFVRDFAGNPDYVESPESSAGGSGRRIEVVFLDKEVLRGRTLNYRPNALGFFLVPDDAASNNLRVFVLAGAVRNVRFL